MYAHLFGHVFMWATGLTGLYALCLQIYENHRLKTTTGLGIYKIWCGSTAALLNIPKVYLLPIVALPRKILYPFEYATTIIFIVQDYRYNKSHKRRQRFNLLYTISLIVAVTALLIALTIGNSSYRLISMVGMVFSSFSSIPQIIHIYRQKSTYGLSKTSAFIHFSLVIIGIIVSQLIFREDWIYLVDGLRLLTVRSVIIFQIFYFGSEKPTGDRAKIW